MHQSISSPAAGARAHRDATTLAEAGRQQIIGLLLLLVTLGLIVAPWIVGYPDSAKDAHRNELGVAIVVFLVALRRFAHYPGARPDLLVLAAGAWLAVSPWALSMQKTAVFDGTRITDVIIGCLYIALSVVSLAMMRNSRERGGDRPTDTL
ncbi:SPW repeat protein [Streptomyces ziwulingensis]